MKVTFKDVLSARVGKTNTSIRAIVARILGWIKGRK